MNIESYLLIAIVAIITISILAKREWLGAAICGVFFVVYAIFKIQIDATSALIFLAIGALQWVAAYKLYKKQR